jgi:hypothetical protein
MLECRDLCIELAREPAVVGVEERDILGRAARQPGIARSGGASIVRQRDEFDGRAVRRGQRGGGIARAMSTTTTLPTSAPCASALPSASRRYASAL